MKVYVNRKPHHGPVGGGNKFVTRLIERISGDRHTVVHTLAQHDIDVIFCFDPRPNDVGEWYKHMHEYKQKHGAKIIQRVGDVGTHGKPHLTELVKQTINYSDFLIFPSQWSKEKIGYSGERFQVINNRPLEIFYENRVKDKKIEKRINLVTHHWSTNPKKGFNFYSMLDEFTHKSNYNFIYIGRIPDNFKFKYSTHVQPMTDGDLSKILPRNHIYVTASSEEAGANHVLEALAAGLPVVYHNNGGSIVDYCQEYGEGYSSFDEMIKCIKKITEKYSDYEEKVFTYNDKINDAIDRYMEIIYAI